MAPRGANLAPRGAIFCVYFVKYRQLALLAPSGAKWRHLAPFFGANGAKWRQMAPMVNANWRKNGVAIFSIRENVKYRQLALIAPTWRHVAPFFNANKMAPPPFGASAFFMSFKL